MPYIVQGEPTTPKRIDYSEVKADYDYPYGLDLRPDSDFHQKLRNKIWQRARESRLQISKRFDAWNEIDRTLTAYIPLKEKEKQIKEKDSTRPVSIVFPYTYSILESLLTYLIMAFFQDPMFQYEGVEDDDTIGAMLMELVIRLDCIKTKVPLTVHTTMRDAMAYGIGPAIPGWEIITGKVPIKSRTVIDGGLGRSEDQFVDFVPDTIFEGNKLDNIDPYMYIVDPSVASSNIQDGEYIGWIDRQNNYMKMLSEEQDPNSGVFNVKYLSAVRNKRSSLAYDQSNREIKDGGPIDYRRRLTDSTNPVDNINMYVTLIPKEWGLTDGEYPEKWFFRLSADDVITECYRADHNHGMYPVAVASPEYDGYSSAPIGRLEMLYGMQNTLDFMFNSHVANVRKSINDMLVVDPYLVNIKDLETPEPGKLIRLRRPAWGRGVDKVVQQLAVQDITRANIADATYITSMMDRVMGTDSSMQGALRHGGPERLTKGEFQGTRASAISRLQRIAMITGMQFMQDIGTMFAVHTQQYMTKERYVKITGRYEEQLRKQFGKTASRVPVTPFDLAINTDLIVRDGSIPGGNFSDVWIEMFKVIGQDPELRKNFNITEIFTYIAQQLGAKNVEDFKRNIDRIQPQVQPDEDVLREADKGNLVPVGVE
jgi:hypothetical protein